MCLTLVSTRCTATINVQVSDVCDVRGSMVRGGGGGGVLKKIGWDLTFVLASKSGSALYTKYVKLIREFRALLTIFVNLRSFFSLT